jgi:hypothetical protein
MEDELESGRTALQYTDLFLDAAVRKIDGVFGDGYAKANPSLVSAYLSASSENLSTFVQAAMMAQPDLADLLEQLEPPPPPPPPRRGRR